MKFFYLSKNELEKGDILVYDSFEKEINLEAYKTSPGKEDAIQYAGENIPSDLEYDKENDVLYSAKEKPSPYHSLKNGHWIVKDEEAYKNYCFEKIDRIKKEVLEYGFDYKGHRQKCRDKDIAFMVASTVALQTSKMILGKDKTIDWYFEDNYNIEMGLEEISNLMMYGSTFIQSVYNTENYFKISEELTLINKEKFEEKRKEIHNQLVENN